MTSDLNEMASRDAVQQMTDLVGGAVERLVDGLPPHLSGALVNAILNVAVERLIAEEGRDGAAAILISLADAIQVGTDPAVDGPVRIRAADS